MLVAVLKAHGNQSVAVAAEVFGAIANMACDASNASMLGAAGACESEP